MQSKLKIDSETFSKAAEFLPVLRGSLARSTDIEGRPERVTLKIAPDQSSGQDSFQIDDIEGIVRTLQGDAARASIEGLGVISVARPNSQRTGGDLGGQIAVVTGCAGGLGFSIASELVDQGAHVALLDIEEEPVKSAAEKLGGISFVCDVTDPAHVQACVAEVVVQFGGIDILISNAGAAHQGSLLELEDDRFQKAFALNFWSHHYVARSVVQVMLRQRTGGALVFNVSKQAVNPGPDFGAYGTPKAALMALMRQYAVEHGKDGITSNAVNADRIRTGLMTDQMIEERSKARGLTPDQYMRGNLIKREVTGKDVAEAFVYLAKARTSTGAVLTVDGGNVAAMMR